MDFLPLFLPGFLIFPAHLHKTGILYTDHCNHSHLRKYIASLCDNPSFRDSVQSIHRHECTDRLPDARHSILRSTVWCRLRCNPVCLSPVRTMACIRRQSRKIRQMESRITVSPSHSGSGCPADVSAVYTSCLSFLRKPSVPARALFLPEVLPLLTEPIRSIPVRSYLRSRSVSQKHTGKSRRLFQILRSSSGFRFPRPSYRLHG